METGAGDASPRPAASLGVLAAFLSIAFGANAVAIKMSLEGLGPFTNAAIRFTLASATLYLFTRLTSRSLKVDRLQLWNIIFLTILFILQFSFLYHGIDRSNASRAALLINLQPLLVLFLAHFFIPGDRITWRKTFALLLGFAGVVLVITEREGAGSGSRSGDLLILVTTGIWALRAVYMKLIINKLGPFQLAFYPMILSIPFFFLQAFLWDTTMVGSLDARVVWALLYQGLLMASFGFVAWYYLLRKQGAVWLNSFNFLMPLTGVLLGVTLLGEPMTLMIFLALVFVTAGILVIQWSR